MKMFVYTKLQISKSFSPIAYRNHGLRRITIRACYYKSFLKLTCFYYSTMNLHPPNSYLTNYFPSQENIFKMFSNTYMMHI